MVPNGISATAEAMATGIILSLLIESSAVPKKVAADTVSPPRGGRLILSAIEVAFASRSMVHLTGRSRVVIPF
jgi:hypothetical protein